MRRALLHVSLALIGLLVVLELLMRLLPVSTATMVGDHLKAGIPTPPPHHRWTMATGWDLRNAQTLKANAQGFSARHDFGLNPEAVALVGDSFVEASMLRSEHRLDAQLESYLQGRPVYAMGSPGSSLLDYGHRLAWARREFKVRDAVVFMERLDVTQSRCGSGNTTSLCWNRQREAVEVVELGSPSAVKKILRHSALAQYLVSQIRLDLKTLWANALTQAQPAQGHDVGKRKVVSAPVLSRQVLGDDERQEIERISAHFFEQVRGWPGRLVLVVDASRAGLQQGDTGSSAAREHFMALARAEGIHVVDMAPVFSQHLRESPLALEVGPYDGHLNPLGLSLVAQAAAKALAHSKP